MWLGEPEHEVGSQSSPFSPRAQSARVRAVEHRTILNTAGHGIIAAPRDRRLPRWSTLADPGGPTSLGNCHAVTPLRGTRVTDQPDTSTSVGNTRDKSDAPAADMVQLANTPRTDCSESHDGDHPKSLRCCPRIAAMQFGVAQGEAGWTFGAVVWRDPHMKRSRPLPNAGRRTLSKRCDHHRTRHHTQTRTLLATPRDETWLGYRRCRLRMGASN